MEVWVQVFPLLLLVLLLVLWPGCATVTHTPGPALILDLDASMNLLVKLEDPAVERLPSGRDTLLSVQIKKLPPGKGAKTWRWSGRPLWRGRGYRSSGSITTWLVARGWYRGPGRYRINARLEPVGKSRPVTVDLDDQVLELQLRLAATEGERELRRITLRRVRRSLPGVRLVRTWRQDRLGQGFYRLENHSQETLRGTVFNGTFGGELQRWSHGRWSSFLAFPEGICGNQPGPKRLPPGGSVPVSEMHGQSTIPGDLDPGRYRFVLHYIVGESRKLPPWIDVYQLVDELTIPNAAQR
jgi:hypothetical protein